LKKTFQTIDVSLQTVELCVFASVFGRITNTNV